MNQLKSMASANKPSLSGVKPKAEEQFLYLGRWVDKKGFRAFVYNKQGEQKLADSYQEFENLIASGLWFDVRQEVSPKRKNNDAAVSNSK